MMKGIHSILVAFTLLALACSLASPFDPDPLQDFCVAIKDKDIKNGGRHPTFKTSIMLMFIILMLIMPKHARNTSNPLGSNVTVVDVDKLLGLNTLGISLSRLNFAPYGLNPPHTHPRGTEILVVVQGTLYVGFVSSNPDNRLFNKILYPGDVFVFPIGLIHFQFNVGKTVAVAFSGLSSQNAGLITLAKAVFGSNPPINPDVLAKAFQLDKDVVKDLQSQLWSG
ncbi:hypothetical protein V6N11_074024 [Hibiscus sabdariffa]|uniref:Germin-like protein n=2 Tax=Hibiscus sabdariffa TaxID=183260 RepID=A0ABR2BK78_9ROSI